MGLLKQIRQDIQNKKRKALLKNGLLDSNTGDNNIISQGSNLKSDSKFYSGIFIDNSLNASMDVFNVMNKYRGTLDYALETPLFSPQKNISEDVPTAAMPASPSLFNPYYGVPRTGIVESLPLLDNTKNHAQISAKRFNGGNVNSQINLYDINDCSIKNLVNLSNESEGILGQARYKYSDFMYCKELGKISNNYLITLRRFERPVGDNIFRNSTALKSNISVNGDIGRMITWFGTEENKLEDILKYTYNAEWVQFEAERQEMASQENDDARGPIGKIVNIFNTKNNNIADKAYTSSGADILLKSLGADVADAPYANNPAVNGSAYDKNKIYEPEDTLRSVYEYKGNLVFEHEFTLTFNYKLRGYDNINAKSAFLDLLANILVVTYRTGTFWPGEQHVIGIPQNIAGWNKAESLIDGIFEQTDSLLENLAEGKPIGDSAGIFAQQVGSMLDGVLGINVQDIFTNPKETLESISEKLKDTNFLNGIKASIKNKLGRPSIYAFHSFLTNDNTGVWHVTIGNPLNPIVSMGNLIITNCEISHSGPLGLDDFPTELKCVVTLKHARPRDAVDIQRMYTKGRNAVYTKNANANNYKSTIDTSGSDSTGVVDVSKGKVPNETSTAWIGDFFEKRIQANRDALK
jgi:hypothetical protein